MKIKQILHSLFLVLFLALWGCRNDGFQVNESGTKYKFFTKNANNRKVKQGYYVDFHLIQKDYKDSLMNDHNYIELFPSDTLKDPTLDAFRMMSEGDSALFKLSTDTLFARRKKAGQQQIEAMKQRMTMQMAQAPDEQKKKIEAQWQQQIQMVQQQINMPDPNLPTGKYITYIIKINGVKTEEEMRKAQEEKMEKQKKTDDVAIVEYLKKNKLEAKSTASGLYYIIQTEGSGALPKRGDTVSVNYTGRFMDGKIFDTSVEASAKEGKVYNPNRPYEPLKFPLGIQPMIKGWEEAMYFIKKGSKAKIILPSHLAYGPAGSPPDIAPNTILIFDLEMADIKPGKLINIDPAPNSK